MRDKLYYFLSRGVHQDVELDITVYDICISLYDAQSAAAHYFLNECQMPRYITVCFPRKRPSRDGRTR